MCSKRLRHVSIILAILLLVALFVINAELRLQQGHASVLFYNLSANFNWLLQSLSSDNHVDEDLVDIVSRHRAINLEAAAVLLHPERQDILDGLEQIWPHSDDLNLADRQMTEIYKSMSRHSKGAYLTLREFEALCTSLIEEYLKTSHRLICPATP
ncbi:MAG: hypothetical protein FD169_1857 [Bacillota bacterium]|nr:MAG: hypothetical protein FD169_1857 [Bacillota bacterium]